MRAIILLAILGCSLLLTACDSLNVVPAQDQTTNNGVDSYRIK